MKKLLFGLVTAISAVQVNASDLQNAQLYYNEIVSSFTQYESQICGVNDPLVKALCSNLQSAYKTSNKMGSVSAGASTESFYLRAGFLNGYLQGFLDTSNSYTTYLRQQQSGPSQASGAAVSALSIKAPAMPVSTK